MKNQLTLQEIKRSFLFVSKANMTMVILGFIIIVFDIIHMLFGQKRIAPQFSSMSGVDNSLIEGRLLKDVAEDLKSGKLHPDEFLIRFVELPNAQKVTLNNRGLAVLSMSGKTPTSAVKVPLSEANPKLLADIGQKGYAGDVVPSNKIAVTTQKNGGGHMYNVVKSCG